MKERFEELLKFKSKEEETEHKAQMLAFDFLSIVDAEMERQKISKKKLAEQVGTSPAYITQLFMGDRKPNWTILTKMQEALGLEFLISTKALLDEQIAEAILSAHKKWVKEGYYHVDDNRTLYKNFEVTTKQKHKFALAS